MSFEPKLAVAVALFLRLKTSRCWGRVISVDLAVDISILIANVEPFLGSSCVDKVNLLEEFLCMYYDKYECSFLL